MDALTYDLMNMLKSNEDGSFTTRANRRHMLSPGGNYILDVGVCHHYKSSFSLRGLA